MHQPMFNSSAEVDLEAQIHNCFEMCSNKNIILQYLPDLRWIKRTQTF